jgi:hypothetical protein
MPDLYLVSELCEYLGWGITDLMRQANISYPTAEKAIKQTGNLSNSIKRDICSALSRGLNRDILPGEVEWTTTNPNP